MTSVYLITAEPVTAAAISATMIGLGALCVHANAWVIPWARNTQDLRQTLATCMRSGGGKLVIAEITGEYSLI